MHLFRRSWRLDDRRGSSRGAWRAAQRARRSSPHPSAAQERAPRGGSGAGESDRRAKACDHESWSVKNRCRQDSCRQEGRCQGRAKARDRRQEGRRKQGRCGHRREAPLYAVAQTRRSQDAQNRRSIAGADAKAGLRGRQRGGRHPRLSAERGRTRGIARRARRRARSDGHLGWWPALEKSRVPYLQTLTAHAPRRR